MKIEVIPQSTVAKLIKVKYPDDIEYIDVNSWCEDNCRGSFYHGRDWTNWMSGRYNRCVEFVDEQDAVVFALRWV